MNSSCPAWASHGLPLRVNSNPGPSFPAAAATWLVP